MTNYDLLRMLPLFTSHVSLGLLGCSVSINLCTSHPPGRRMYYRMLHRLVRGAAAFGHMPEVGSGVRVNPNPHSLSPFMPAPSASEPSDQDEWLR